MIRKIEPKVTHRCCPGCGDLVTQVEVELAVLDFKCLKCGKHTFREFQPVKFRRS